MEIGIAGGVIDRQGLSCRFSGIATLQFYAVLAIRVRVVRPIDSVLSFRAPFPGAKNLAVSFGQRCFIGSEELNRAKRYERQYSRW
jgi:hypothetical protein